jgi:hypothetical protein
MVMPVQQWSVGLLSGLLFLRHLQNDDLANALHGILAQRIGRKYVHGSLDSESYNDETDLKSLVHASIIWFEM